MPADFLAIPYKETGFLNISDAIDRYLKSNVSKAVRLLRDMICILRPPPPLFPNMHPWTSMSAPRSLLTTSDASSPTGLQGRRWRADRGAAHPEQCCGAQRQPGRDQGEAHEVRDSMYPDLDAL